MNTIFNFGDPHKDFTPVADEILKDYKVINLPITNNKVFYNNELQIISACYGVSPVLDSLSFMVMADKIKEKDNIVFIGSMGSFSSDIKLDDLVIPVQLYCAYYGFRREILFPNQNLLEKLKHSLSEKNHDFFEYPHGSVMAVFDSSTDHENYRNSLYGDLVKGVDCTESFIGIKFCDDNNLFGVALLYCSDDPVTKIAEIPKEEFDKRALERDLEIHYIAADVFKRI